MTDAYTIFVLSMTLIFSLFVSTAGVSFAAEKTEKLSSHKSKIGATGIFALALYGLAIQALGFAPWQEISEDDYNRFAKMTDSNPETLFIAKDAIADGEISRLEFQRLKNAYDRDWNDGVIAISKAHIRREVAEMDASIITDAKLLESLNEAESRGYTITAPNADNDGTS